MFGFLIFYNICLNLGDKCRDRLLGRIFDISDVAVSSVSIIDNRFIIKLFSVGVFYQYVIVVGSGADRVYKDVKIVDYVIFTEGNEFFKFNGFIHRLFQCQEEYQVYQLVRRFL